MVDAAAVVDAAAAVVKAATVVDSAAAVVDTAAAVVNAATVVDAAAAAIFSRPHACGFRPAGRHACKRAPCVVAYRFTYSVCLPLQGPAAYLRHWRAGGQRSTIGHGGRGCVLCASLSSVSPTRGHMQARRYTHIAYNIYIDG